MGAGGSIEGGGEGGGEAPQARMVTQQEAGQIMSVIFSRPITHASLKEFLLSTRRDMVDEATIQQIIAILDAPPQAQAQPQQQQQQQVPADGSVVSVVRQAFFGKFDSVKQAFHAADVNGGGTISTEEFAQCIRGSGLDITDDQVLQVATAVDTDGDGNINYAEFLQFLTNGSIPDEYAQNAVCTPLCFAINAVVKANTRIYLRHLAFMRSGISHCWAASRSDQRALQVHA